MRLNPEAIDGDKAFVQTEVADKKPFTDKAGTVASTTLSGGQIGELLPVQQVEDERPDIAHGVGSLQEFETRLTKEDEPVPFAYEARLFGKRVKEALHFPKLGFDYTIEKVGTRLVDERTVGYSVRVDAHPRKLIKGALTHVMRNEKEQSYRAELEINTTAPRNEYRSRIRWDGVKEVTTHADVKDIFVSSSTLHVTGKGKTATWQKRDGQVIDVKNASWFSGVISGTHIGKSHYEAEFEFTPTYTTDQKYAIVRRVTKDHKVVKPSKHGEKKYWDDDIVGMIFKAKSKTDFYVLLWESDERLGRSSRIGDISGRHITDEQLFLRDTIVSPVGPGMTSISKKKWDEYTKEKGWGENHAKVYRVVNGVFHKVSLSDKRKENAGWTFGVRQGMRVVSQGKRVKLYLKNRSNAGWGLAFEFDSAYEEGSFGMCNISQAVLFHKVRYVENQKISGVIPQEGWHRTKKPSLTLTTDTMAYVRPFAKRQAGGKKCEVLHVKAEEDPKTAKFGSTTVKFPEGGITIKTKNPDKSKLLTYTFTESGSMLVTPDKDTPSKAVTAFDGAMNLFKDKIDAWKKSHPDQKIVDYDFDLIEPTMQDDDDWDLIGTNNEKLVFWNSSVKEETVDVSLPVYAYQGKVSHPLSEWFSVNTYSSASFDVDETTFDRWHDEWSLSGGGETLSLDLKTNEWYKGVQADHLRLYGSVSSKEPLSIPMPAMPEHYVHPIEEGPMYHGHEVVHYTLLQLSPTDFTAFASFNLAGDATTERANATNATTGQPLVVTETQLDTIYIKAKPNPRLVAWRSGSKTGTTSVNGVRPFLSEARGQQTVLIGTKEIKEPEDLASLDRIDVRVTDARVQFTIVNGDVLFYSPYQSNYRYTKDWHGAWKDDLTPRTATYDPKLLHDGVVLDPQESPDYDSSILIEGIEGRASTPFVQLTGKTVNPTARGLVGRYHQKAGAMRLVEDIIKLEGEVQHYEQRYTVPAWKTEQEISIPYGGEVVSVNMDGQTLASTAYTIKDEKLKVERPALKAGELVIKYRTGEIKRSYALAQWHGDNVKVFVGSTRLTAQDYELKVGRITLAPSLTLKAHDTVTIRSFQVSRPYGANDTTLGRYVGARIDNEIWYDWGVDGPFPLLDNVTAQATGYHEAAIEAKVAYDEMKSRDVAETISWRQYDVAPTTDVTNYGVWVGREQDYDELTILSNGMLSAKLSPTSASERVGVHSNIMMQGLDNDAAGLLIQSADKRTSYVLGWDTNGTGFKGLKLQKWTCSNPEQEGAVALSHVKTTLYENAMFFGEPGEDSAMMSSVSEHTMRMILDKTKREITVWIDGNKLVTTPVDVTAGDFSVGVFAESQADTRFRDIVTFEQAVLTSAHIPALRQIVMKEIEPPIATGATNSFEYAISDLTMAGLFDATVQAAMKERFIVDYRMSYQIVEGAANVYFDETMNKATVSATDKVMVLVEGVAPPVPPPVLLPQDTVPAPNIPDEELPVVSTDDAFAIEWSGYLEVQKSGTHVFEITANDGVILEIDGKKVFESFGLFDGKPREARIELVGGTHVRFRMRYYENRGYAYARLRMREPGGLMRRIPKARFVPYTGFLLEAKKSLQYPEPWALQVKAGDLFFGRSERHVYVTPKEERLSLDGRMTITLSERPRLGAPVHVLRGAKHYQEVFYLEDGKTSLYQTLTYGKTGATRVTLPVREIDKELVEVRRNGVKEPFEVEGRGLLFVAPIATGEVITIRFADPLSYYRTEENGNVVFCFPHNIGADYGPMIVTYETSEEEFKRTDLTLNPVRSRRKGMAFYEEVPLSVAANLTLKLSENRIESGQVARIVATAHLTDAFGNPVENENVTFQLGATVTTLRTDDAGIARKVFHDFTDGNNIIVRSGDCFDVGVVSKGEMGYRIQMRQQGEEVFFRKETVDGSVTNEPMLVKLITASGITPFVDVTRLTLPVGQAILIGQVGGDMARIACQRKD